MACVFDDGGTLVGEYVVDRGSQTCGAKACWKLTGKEGYAYADKAASAAGIVKMKFAGGDTAPTIELVTKDGLCVGATINKVTKDAGGQYKAQKK